MPSFRRLLIIALGMALPLGLCLVLVEIGMRFLPVPNGMKAAPVSAAAPVFHFTPNRDVSNSVGWQMANYNWRHTNNAGFINDQDYQAEGARPLLAVIGDSYVEAATVPYDRTFYGRLAERTKGQGRVYSFGTGGAPMSQYLIWARYARERFGADAFVFLIISNDFDESLLWDGAATGFHHYERNQQGALALTLAPFEPGPLRRIARESALGRYLHHNLQITLRLQRLKRQIKGEAEPRYVGNVLADAPPERMALSREAVDAFFRDLPSYAGVAPDRIVLMLDGIRPQLYDAAELAGVADSYFAQMRGYFMSRAEALGYEVIDLQPRFIARYKTEGRHFEDPVDAHWNALGHEEAAAAVAASQFFTALFGAADRAAPSPTTTEPAQDGGS